MSFNIHRFRSQGLTQGGARPALFEVNFPNITNLQTILPTTAQLGDEQITFLCTAASIPESRVNQTPVYYFGRPVNFAADREFAPWVTTILNDEDFKLRDFFEAWSNQINSLVGNVAASADPRNYKIDDVSVRQLSKAGPLIREYFFAGMWPSVVSDIQLSWEQGNRIETFDVRFAYDWWTPAKSGQPDQNQTSPATYDVGDSGDLTGLTTRVT